MPPRDGCCWKPITQVVVNPLLEGDGKNQEENDIKRNAEPLEKTFPGFGTHKTDEAKEQAGEDQNDKESGQPPYNSSNPQPRPVFDGQLIQLIADIGWYGVVVVHLK